MWVLSAIASGFLIITVLTIAIASLVWLWRSIFTNRVRRERSTAQSMNAVKPPNLRQILRNPARSIAGGIQRVVQSTRSIRQEIAYTENLEQFEYTTTGTRFRAHGTILSQSRISAPLTGKKCAISKWEIEGFIDGEWVTESSGIHAAPFFISAGKNTDSRILVNPKADTDYDIRDGETSIIDVQPGEEIPTHLQQFIEESPPLSADRIRLRETRLESGFSVSVFGEFCEKNRHGRWEKVIDDPDAEEVRLVISTGDVETLEQEVWRDASGGVMWGLLLFAAGSGELATLLFLAEILL